LAAVEAAAGGFINAMRLNKKGKKIGVLGFNVDNVSAILRHMRSTQAPLMRCACIQVLVANAAVHHRRLIVASYARTLRSRTKRTPPTCPAPCASCPPEGAR
jgi:hypothetical protein